MARPVTLTVGPLVAGSATKIGTSQKSAAAGYLVLNGAAGVATANSICASQTPGGAGALTLNGSLTNTNGYVIPTQGYVAGTIVAAGTAAAYLPYPQRIYITGGSNESGKTFTVSGYAFSANGIGPVAVTETITGPNASIVSSANLYSVITSITVSAGTAGAITVGNYGTATLDTARRIIVTSGGDDSGITFAIAGTDLNGNPLSETLTGANAGAAQSALDYYTITSIRASAAVATTVTIGTNGVASAWIYLDAYAASAPTAIQCTPSAAGANFTVQQTLDDANAYNPATNLATMTWVNHPDSTLVAATSTVQGNYAYAPQYARVVLNSGNGSVRMTLTQQGTW